uniref:Cytochrome P450 n=1 Tax=Zooxanthella nutricula TaxID=1333877 RepID=A0A7S2P0H8_9DINO
MERKPLMKRMEPAQIESWGSIDDVVDAPLIDVAPDASWLSVIGMWLCCPCNLIQGCFGGCIQWFFVCFSVGTCCIPLSYDFCSAAGSVVLGRPIWMAWTWWRYTFAGLTALLANGMSRLALFMWEWRAFGSAAYWWHGEGVWCWSYAKCDEILRGVQFRKSAFGCVRACIPDLFATSILIFLTNHRDPLCEWANIRDALHKFFLDRDNAQYQVRVNALPAWLASDWPNPKLDDLNDKARLQRSVCKCVFYVMFGKWIDDADATTLTGWRTNATFFILPRLVQRFIFNYGINKVKQLRKDTIAIVVKYEQEQVFFKMNDSLRSQWQRLKVVKLADEIMYVIGFAGMGGTAAAVESCASFLQAKIPSESAANAINFGEYNTPEKMRNKYLEDPVKYIKETCRLDPPVTSATATLTQYQEVELAGTTREYPNGLLNQYTLSMANRDKDVFANPEVFNPDRPELSKALTWNGAFGATDEGDYPRICPGRWLSMDITKAILNHALQGPGSFATAPADLEADSRGQGCC